MVGEEVRLVGDSTAVGKWDATKGIPLKYSDHYWWQTPEFKIESDFKYKYVKIGNNKVIWEDIENRQLSITQSPPIIIDAFNRPASNPIFTSNNIVDVMSFNVRVDVKEDYHKWVDRRYVISTVIASRKPHFIGFQEPVHHQLEDLLRLNPTYKHIGIGRSGGNTGEYSPILYDTNRFEVIDSGTFWLSPTPDTVSQGWGAACLRVCSWAIFTDKQNLLPENTRILMLNTHLDHISIEARREGMALVLQKIKKHPGIPVILTGDFNVIPYDEVIRMVQQDLILTAERAERKINENSGTFTGWSPKNNNQAPIIDYIFVNKYFTTMLYEIITEFDNEHTLASDHRPIIAKIKMLN